MSTATSTGRGGLLMRMRQDDGIGLIVVIGVTAFITALVATAAMISINGMAGSRQRTAWEQSLASAESGIDFALARVQRAWDEYASDYPIPSTTPLPDEGAKSFCSASAVTAPETFASDSAERTWAKAQLTTLATQHPECIKTTDSGQWLVFKPATELVNGKYPRYGRIYAIGWAPSRAKPTSVRVVKSEYVFMPYRPTNAVLTGGNLVIDSSTTITAAAGNDPSVASVHSNGSIAGGPGGGNPIAWGPVTSTLPSTFSSNKFYANTGGKVSLDVTQPVPRVDAYSFYYHAEANDTGSTAATNWFDLCPDGTARPYSTGGPCTSGTMSAPAINGSSVRGWSYDKTAHMWTASKDVLSGTYFVYQADVNNGVGNATVPNLTVIAAAENNDDCSDKQYGNITWDHYTLAAPKYHNMFFYADGDIVTTSNFSAGSGISSPPVISGMFVAGDQIQMETSSQGAVGSVTASDQCNTAHAPTTNEIKNPSVYYDPNADAPFTSIVTTTLWAEIQS